MVRCRPDVYRILLRQRTKPTRSFFPTVRNATSFAEPLLSPPPVPLAQPLLPSSTPVQTCNLNKNNTRRVLVPTQSATVQHIPLTIVDAQMRHEQLPFAYFFQETLDSEMLASSLQEVLRWNPILGGSMDLNASSLAIRCQPGDAVPLSFCKSDKTMDHWMQEGKGHAHHGGAGHPTLLPLFEPLFQSATNTEDIEFDQESSAQDIKHDEPRNHQIKGNGNHPLRHLVTIRITYFSGGGTAIGVNMNHALADAASCIWFVQCWGREMQKKSYPKGASNDRSEVTCSGMLTPEVADLMGLHREEEEDEVDFLLHAKDVVPQFVTDCYLKATAFYQELSGMASQSLASWDNDDDRNVLNDKKSTGTSNQHDSTTSMDDSSTTVGHEYVHLPFTPSELQAMKLYGAKACAAISAKQEVNVNTDMSTPAKPNYQEENAFVSTNDMLTAFGWLMKRHLSGRPDWNMSVVMNLRGRCGVNGFSDMNSKDGTTYGLFGNGITNVIASLPSRAQAEGQDVLTRGKKRLLLRREVFAAARAIRRAISEGLVDLPDRMLQSRMGRPRATNPSSGTEPATVSSAPSFCTTSWGQFPLWDIGFSPHAKLAGFHGHPSFPLPMGRTFTSVIAPRQNGGFTYQLLLPSDQVEEAARLHRETCDMFLRWMDRQQHEREGEVQTR